MRVLITGVTGFAGSHLAEYCLAQGCEVWGTKRRRSSLANLSRDVLGRLELLDMELEDARSVANAVAVSEPEWLFHLAGQSFVPESWTSPYWTLQTNLLGTLNVLEVMRERPGRIHVACSSEEYGLVQPEECPIAEDQPLRPISPYGVSKVAVDMLAGQYARSYGMDVVRTRAFNHTGARRGEEFVTSNFAKQAVEIEAGQREFLQHGNLDAVRDFTHVKDMVRAYWLALERGYNGEVYNVCTSRATRISDLLPMLADLLNVEIETWADPERMRPSDVPLLVGDSAKFREHTGWEPTLGIEDAMADLVGYWQEQLKVKTHA